MDDLSFIRVVTDELGRLEREFETLNRTLIDNLTKRSALHVVLAAYEIAAPIGAPAVATAPRARAVAPNVAGLRTRRAARAAIAQPKKPAAEASAFTWAVAEPTKPFTDAELLAVIQSIGGPDAKMKDISDELGRRAGGRVSYESLQSRIAKLVGKQKLVKTRPAHYGLPPAGTAVALDEKQVQEDR